MTPTSPNKPASLCSSSGDAAIPTVNIGRVWEYQHHVYYIREDSQGSNTIPVLMQGRLQNNALDSMVFDIMVEGIERLHFIQMSIGAVPGQMDCWLPQRSLKH